MKKRVLLIDDSQVVLAMAGDALEQNGFEVIRASSGLEANRYLFQKEKPDIIIIDVMIPLLNGNKTTQLIKANEHTKDIPVLLLSSKPVEELRQLAKDSGADGFIQKPFEVPVLVQKIEETLLQHRKQ